MSITKKVISAIEIICGICSFLQIITKHLYKVLAVAWDFVWMKLTTTSILILIYMWNFSDMDNGLRIKFDTDVENSLEETHVTSYVF